VNVPRGFPAGGVIRTAVPGTGPEAAKSTGEGMGGGVFGGNNRVDG